MKNLRANKLIGRLLPFHLIQTRTTVARSPIRWITIFGFGLLIAQSDAQESTSLKNEKEQQSYAIGADLARNLKRQGVQVDVEPLLKGIRDGLAGTNLLMTDDAIRDTLRAYQNDLRKKRFQLRGGTAAIAEKNRDEGAAFLQENKLKSGMVCLPSGLQYKVLKAGTGPKPKASDTVECRHHGTFLDGREFNNSERAGQSVGMKVSSAIPGLREALPLMPVGSKWQIFIPSQLAYGETGVLDGAGRVKVEPNATLIFEVELLAIN